MSARHLRRIALALVILLALWGVAQLFSHRSDQVGAALRLPPIPAQTTDTITIGRGRDTVRLAQISAGVWTANGHPATPGAAADLVRALSDTSPRELAAMSASSLGRMGVDTAAWSVRVGPAAHPRFILLVGAAGPEYGSGYVRPAGSDSVYLWRGQLPYLVRRPLDVWRDHHVASVPSDSIQSIEVTQAGKTFSVRRNGTGWMVGAARADSSKMAILLAQFRNIEAQGFATPAQADTLGHLARRIRRTVTVRGKGAAPLLALTLDSLSGSFWVTRAGDATLYRFDDWQVTPLTPTAKSLLTKP